LRREIVPLVHPILGFEGQEVNPIGMICLLLYVGDKAKARNLEVDFFVVDIPTAYYVILGRPTLHKVKVVMYFNFSSKLTMEVLTSCEEIDERSKSATLSASDHLWNGRSSANSQWLHLRTKSHRPRLLLLPKP